MSKKLAKASKKFGFSEQQNAVAKLFLMGDTKRAIAEKMGISFWTVDAHLRRIYRKISAHSQAEFFLCILSRD